MRFISHIKKFGVQCIPYRERPGVMGVEVLCPGYTAEFRIGDVTDAEVAFAKSVFSGMMNGVTYEVDEVTPVSLLSRLAVYDSDEHDEEFALIDRDTYNPATKEYGMPSGWARAEVEKQLLARQSAEMKLVEEVKVEAPWPTYNEFRGSVDDLVMKVLEDGYPIPQVIAYERQNLNRRDVIGELESAYADFSAQEGEVVPA